MRKNTMLGDMKVIFVSRSNGAYIAINKDAIVDPKKRRRSGRKAKPKLIKPKQIQIEEEIDYGREDSTDDTETYL